MASGAGQDGGVDVLSSRILLRPADLGRSRRFYRDVLGLAVYREFGSPGNPAMVFFLGAGLLEVSGSSAGPAGNSLQIWLEDPDGVRIVLVEVPPDHPLRRDPRSALPPPS